MIRTILAASSLAAVLLFAGQPAQADWLCGSNKCIWVSYDVDEPDFAEEWAPPTYPNCFWKQGLFGRWKLVCPRI